MKDMCEDISINPRFKTKKKIYDKVHYDIIGKIDKHIWYPVWDTVRTKIVKEYNIFMGNYNGNS